MNKRKSGLILFILSGAVIILLVVLSITKIKHMNETSSKIASGTILLEEKQDKLLKLKELEKLKPQLEYALTAVNEKIPELPLEPELINQIQQLTEKNGFKLIQLQFDDRIERNDVNEMPFILSISGRYSSLVKLIENMEAGKRLIRIDEVVITREDGVMTSITADIYAVAFSNGN